MLFRAIARAFIRKINSTSQPRTAARQQRAKRLLVEGWKNAE